jgi:hypothetical protein
VWSRLVAITSPRGDNDSGVVQSVEVVIIEALVSKLAVEAFDVRVLCWLAGRNQLEIDAAVVGPSVERSAREFRNGLY